MDEIGAVVRVAVSIERLVVPPLRFVLLAPRLPHLGFRWIEKELSCHYRLRPRRDPRAGTIGVVTCGTALIRQHRKAL